LLRAGIVLKRKDMRDEALAALRWLCRRQTAPAGHFRPIGTQSFGAAYEAPCAFDQQPLEAWATIDACALAFEQTSEPFWLEHAEAAFAWYLGANDVGLRLATPDGGCFDGLQVDRVNLNQGAESILAYQFAVLAIRGLRAQTAREGRSAASPDKAAPGAAAYA
jgi:hypothetical protein